MSHIMMRIVIFLVVISSFYLPTLQRVLEEPDLQLQVNGANMKNNSIYNYSDGAFTVSCFVKMKIREPNYNVTHQLYKIHNNVEEELDSKSYTQPSEEISSIVQKKVFLDFHNNGDIITCSFKEAWDGHNHDIIPNKEQDKYFKIMITLQHNGISMHNIDGIASATESKQVTANEGFIIDSPWVLVALSCLVSFLGSILFIYIYKAVTKNKTYTVAENGFHSTLDASTITPPPPPTVVSNYSLPRNGRRIHPQNLPPRVSLDDQGYAKLKQNSVHSYAEIKVQDYCNLFNNGHYSNTKI